MSLLLAIIGHLVGDYLLQNDWMALNKKKWWLPLVVHCTLWTISVCVFSGWFRISVIVFLWMTHVIQDSTEIVRWWMEMIGQHQFRTGPCSPWSTIVVDNVWHILALFVVWKWCL